MNEDESTRREFAAGVLTLLKVNSSAHKELATATSSRGAIKTRMANSRFRLIGKRFWVLDALE